MCFKAIQIQLMSLLIKTSRWHTKVDQRHGLTPLCSSLLSGFGKGVNVVNYEGSSWHEYCFNCKKCSLSLSNKRFVAKGKDILCTDCGNK